MDTVLQSLIRVEVGILVALIAAIAFIARQAWPHFVAVKDFLDDWKGTPARYGSPADPGVLERIAIIRKAVDVITDDAGTLRTAQASQRALIDEISKQVAETNYHTKPNSGKSAWDKQTRMLQELSVDVKGFGRRMDLSELDRRILFAELTRLHPDSLPRIYEARLKGALDPDPPTGPNPITKD